MKATTTDELRALHALTLFSTLESKSIEKTRVPTARNFPQKSGDVDAKFKKNAVRTGKPINDSHTDQQCELSEKDWGKLRVEPKFRLLQVPLDGSSAAEHALPLAASLAKRDGATLQLVRVNQPISSHIFLHRWDTKVADVNRGLMDEHSNNLDPTVRKLLKATGLRPNSVQLDGSVPETIARYTSTSEADLLIMTTHGRGPLSRLWFGSVADSLVRQSSIPILFVRPQENEPDFTQLPSVKHVLIPLDGSKMAEQVLESALTLANTENREITLLRIVPTVMPGVYDPTIAPPTGNHPSWRQQLYDLQYKLGMEALEYLEQVADQLRTNSMTVHTRVVAHKQPATAILDMASSGGADAIALTTRGQGGLKRLLLGSVADKVIRGATMPVLICPPDAGRDDIE